MNNLEKFSRHYMAIFWVIFVGGFVFVVFSPINYTEAVGIFGAFFLWALLTAMWLKSIAEGKERKKEE